MKQDSLHFVTPVAVIRRADGRILLLKRRDNEVVYPGYYTFPGGKMDGNETIYQTLVREVKEECGLDLQPGIVLIKEKAIRRPDGQTSKSLSFLCEVQNPAQIKIDKSDFTGYTWANLEELRVLPHVGIEAEFIKVATIFNVGADQSVFFTDHDQVDLKYKV